jgi:ABC-type transport system involved in cytochrome c biogenesis permease subunit
VQQKTSQSQSQPQSQAPSQPQLQPQATSLPWLTAALAALGVIVLLSGIFTAFIAPPDVKQGFLIRILPVHAVAGQVSYIAFATTLVASVLYWPSASCGLTESP